MNSELLRQVNYDNHILKEQSRNLKVTREDLNEHINTLIKRTKQLTTLKSNLNNELKGVTEDVLLHNRTKHAYCIMLREEVAILQKKLFEQEIILKNREQQYQLCLKQYDQVMNGVNKMIEGVKMYNIEITDCVESESSMKAMIFDYEKLKRVIEEERRYFKQITNSEEKSHEQRLKELQQMRKRLKQQQSLSSKHLQFCKIRIGLIKFMEFNSKKMKQYCENFLRGWFTTHSKVKLGIHILKNCLQLGLSKHNLTLRSYFYKWHHNIFPKETLSNLVENALINEMNSRQKIKTLNIMVEKINRDQLATLHIYQKAKFLAIVANSARRKDLFYGWNIWKNKALRKKQVEIHLDSLFQKVILQNDLRWAFKEWRNTTRSAKAIQVGGLMLEQLNTTKEIARVFRKWRLAVSKYEFDKVNQFVYQVKMRNKITSKINYEKRKVKALTTLEMKYSKIILRNYFHKYYRNVRMFRVLSMNNNNLNEREIYSQLRVKDKITKQETSSQDLKFSLKAFRKFMMNNKILPSFKKWRTTTAFLKMRSQALLPLLFRKQARDKCFVMNEFRQCVQYYQKKQMHQVLTDLNKKMEAINEKSTDFRERLQKCTSDLGNLASKKMFMTISESQKYLQRNYLLKAMRIKIRQLYKDYLFSRLSNILQISFQRICFKKIEVVAKDQRKEKILQIREKAFNAKANRKIVVGCFKAIHQSLKNHKRAFSLLTHAENVVMFYRMAYAWNALINKKQAQKYKNMEKQYNQLIKFTDNKQNYLVQLLGRQKKLEEKLNELFLKFIAFEDNSQKVKKTRKRNDEARLAWSKYKEGVEDTIYKEKVMENFGNFLIFKNQTIFWQGLISNKYEKIIMQMQEELGKLNKKKKTLLEKNSKARGDLQKRMNQQQAVHQEIFKHVEFFRQKYLRIMNYYVAKHTKMERIRYVSSIFSVWKKQYKGAKNIGDITKIVINRELVFPSFQIIQHALIKSNKKLQSQEIIAQLLLKKGKKCMKYALSLWKCGIKHSQCQKFVFLVNQKVDQFQMVKEQCEEKSQLISKQSVRNMKLKLMIKCFMALKNNTTEQKSRKWKLEPFYEKCNKVLVLKVMAGWKWLMFYKKTKRSYLEFKKNKYEKELKTDVFNSLKIYRMEIYKFANLFDRFVSRMNYDYLKTSYDKIVNVGAYQRDQLNYQRKRAINTLLYKKIASQKLIKRKILAKWNALLIPKDHYLPNILHEVRIRILRSAMGSIKARMYWNQHYAKTIADKVTTRGYSDINNITNGLLKSGFDPDQIKQYLKKRSAKDRITLQKVTSHMKTWAKKQRVVRAWHSWKQYLVLKQNIRKSLRKVLNLAGGLGKYWNRWRGIDPKFMNMLQKQSRGSMLERYKELGVLLKQYKRDLKDSSQYVDELKGINAQYMLYHDHGLQLALSAFSRNIKIGLKQGLRIWRQKARELKRKQLDAQFQDLSQGIALLSDKKSQLRYRIAVLNQQNRQLKQKCLFGGECGRMLQKMMSQKDVLSINLADKQHNMKLLLEDNLRLKQKLRSAQLHAQSLLKKVQEQKY